MKRRTFISLLLGGAVVGWPIAVRAQQTTKVSRMGFLSLSSGQNQNMDILPGLRELGWIEGQNITIEYRWAMGNEHQLPALAAELVRLKVDIIVTSSTPAAQAAKLATTTIPIVMTFVADPVGSGLVASLARPGGNITGLTTLAPELLTKRLQLLTDVMPGVNRIAVLWTAGGLGETLTLMRRETEIAGRALGVELQFFEARRPEDFEQVFSAMTQTRTGALLIFPTPMLFEAREHIVAHAAKSRIPAVYPWREAVEAGGLASYATNFPDMYRKAAAFVDKILKGAKPGDLPVQQPTKFEMVINLKTAKALGLTIPGTFLAFADEVIE